jgi:hypothetical protein
MCNLYSITTNQAAIAALFRVMNHTRLSRLVSLARLFAEEIDRHQHGHDDCGDHGGVADSPEKPRSTSATWSSMMAT